MGIPQVYGLYLHLVFLSGLKPLDGNHLARGLLVVYAGDDRRLVVSAVQRRDDIGPLALCAFLLHAHIVAHLHGRGLLVVGIIPFQ